MTVVTLGELLDAGVHFGHQSSRWNPKMFPYIYKKKGGTHLINLAKTLQLLTYASSFVRYAASENKKFLFVGTKQQAAPIILEEATKSHSFYINNRWLGGILTNWQTVQKRVLYLNELDEKTKNGDLKHLPKKEMSMLRRKYRKLSYNFAGLRGMKTIPDIVIIVDPIKENTAILECKKLGIPIISIVDTDCDPSLIDIPIPANDDAMTSIKLILSVLSTAIVAGKSILQKK